MAKDDGGGGGVVKGLQQQLQQALFLPPSPIFDVPEFPPLRRVVPLPKRRRTTIDAPHDSNEGTAGAIVSKSKVGRKDATTMTMTPDELASTLSTSMALHSYYMPLFQQQQLHQSYHLELPSQPHTTNSDISSATTTTTNVLDTTAAATANVQVSKEDGQTRAGEIFKDDIDARHVDPADLKALGDNRYETVEDQERDVDSHDRFENGFDFGYEYSASGGNGGRPISLNKMGASDDLSTPMSTAPITSTSTSTSTSPPGKPKNFKKRKVPVAAHARLEDVMDPQDGEEEGGEALFGAERGIAAEPIDTVPPAPPPLSHMTLTSPYATTSNGGNNAGDNMSGVVLSLKKRGKLSPAAQAGLQLKEMLRNRKRQLATVLGAFSHNDSLALDQALSGRYPFAKYESQLQSGYATGMAAATNTTFNTIPTDNGKAPQGPPISPSRLRKKRGRVLLSAIKKASVPVDENKRLPECAFSFEHDSPTSDRVRATKNEVAYLQGRFDAEFTRQAAKAAEAARQAALVVSKMQKSKHIERAADQRQNVQSTAISTPSSRTTGLPTTVISPSNGGATTGSLAPGSVTGKPVVNSTSKAKGKKKKKRSALANASNPHHLRNYIPSRLPNSSGLYHSNGYNGGHHSSGAGSAGAGMTAFNMQSYLGPFPFRFLSAALPPRKKRTSGGVTPLVTNLTNPEEEWMCAFCEYNLFYGDEKAFKKALAQRKTILKRRRRAMERAAAAAAGRKKGVASTANGVTGTGVERDEEGEDDYEDEMAEEEQVAIGGIASGRQQRKEHIEQDRDRDKGDGGTHLG